MSRTSVLVRLVVSEASPTGHECRLFQINSTCARNEEHEIQTLECDVRDSSLEKRPLWCRVSLKLLPAEYSLLNCATINTSNS